MDIQFDDVTRFEERMHKQMQSLPRERKSFIKMWGRLCIKDIKKQFRSDTKKKTGNLIKYTKLGRPYMDGDEQKVLIHFSNHAHLIEKGHNIVTPKTLMNTGKRTRAFGSVAKAMNGSQSNYDKAFEKWVNKVIEKGLMY